MKIEPAWFIRPNGRDGSSGIHGTGHTRRVLTLAQTISLSLSMPDWEIEAVDLAACWHDIGRTHEGVDYYHGAKSAGKVIGLGLQTNLDPLIVEAALFAVTHHSGSEPHAEHDARWTRHPKSTLRIFQALKDADALDRVRLGDLDTSFLRFEVSHSLVPRAHELLKEMTR
jgi:HD superfamily phosphodiesterase